LFRYNIKKGKWKFHKYDLLSDGKNLEILDFCVDMRRNSFAYWISTVKYGLVLMNGKGFMKGNLDAIPLKKMKLSLIKRPVSIIKNIYGDLYFLINSSENSEKINYAFILRYSKKIKKFEKLKNPVKDIYFYQQLINDKKNLIFLHDLGCSMIDILELTKSRKQKVNYDKRVDNIMCASSDGKNLYFITYDGELAKLNYKKNKKSGSEKNGGK
jgi:hypothetical protein